MRAPCLEHPLKSLHSRAHRILTALLKSARKSAGWTQQELADAIERPQSFVSAYERGYRNVAVEELIRIGDVLELDIHEVIEAMRQASKVRKSSQKLPLRSTGKKTKR